MQHRLIEKKCIHNKFSIAPIYIHTQSQISITLFVHSQKYMTSSSSLITEKNFIDPVLAQNLTLSILGQASRMWLPSTFLPRTASAVKLTQYPSQCILWISLFLKNKSNSFSNLQTKLSFLGISFAWSNNLK